mgnify:FL=1
MKISDTNQQINRKLELSKAESTDNLVGKKRTEQESKNDATVTESTVIKSDTVELSRESQKLANLDKAKSGDKNAPILKAVNENTLVELLKRADKQRGIFDSSEGISKTDEQENSDNKSGGKIDFLI